MRTSSIVGQAVLDAILRKLVRVGGAESNITNDLGIDDLADDVSVGEAHNQSVFRGVVLGLVLNN